MKDNGSKKVLIIVALSPNLNIPSFVQSTGQNKRDREIDREIER